MVDSINPVYLDYAATTPLDADVAARMHHVQEQAFYNPSSNHIGGRRRVRSLGKEPSSHWTPQALFESVVRGRVVVVDFGPRLRVTARDLWAAVALCVWRLALIVDRDDSSPRAE